MQWHSNFSIFICYVLEWQSHPPAHHHPPSLCSSVMWLSSRDVIWRRGRMLTCEAEKNPWLVCSINTTRCLFNEWKSLSICVRQKGDSYKTLKISMSKFVYPVQRHQPHYCNLWPCFFIIPPVDTRTTAQVTAGLYENNSSNSYQVITQVHKEAISDNQLLTIAAPWSQHLIFLAKIDL